MTFTGAVDLALGAGTTTVTSGAGGGDDITFTSTINDAASNTTLDLNAGAGGNVNLQGAVGGTGALVNFTVTNGNDVNLNSVTAGTIDITAQNNVTAVQDGVTTNQDITATDAGASLTITAGGTLLLQDATAADRRTRLVTTGANSDITLNIGTAIDVQANDTTNADQIVATGNVIIDAGAGVTMAIGDQAAASTFSINDHAMDSISQAGTLTLGDTDSGNISLDRDTVGNGAFVGDLAIISGGTIDDNNNATAFETAGTLTLTSNGIIGASILTLDVNAVNVLGSNVTITDTGANQGDTTFSVSTGGAGDITLVQSTNNMILSGVTTTGALTATSTLGTISDASTTTVSVGTLASFDGNAGVTLGDNAGDTTNFGTLTFNSAAGDVVITEDSDTDIRGANTADNLVLTSSGAIDDTGATSTAITTNASLSGSSINVGVAGATFDAGTLTFNSAGMVTIAEDSDTVLAGNSTAGATGLDLDSTGMITDNGTADLEIGGLADFAGTVITLDDAGHNFGSLTFNSAGAVTIAEEGAVNLVGASGAASLNLDSSTSTITDNGTAVLTIVGLADFAGTVINVSDPGHTFGTLTFNSAGAVTITETDGMDLFGINSAGSLGLTAGTTFTDATATSTTVTGSTTVNATGGISLGVGAPVFTTGTNLTFISAGVVAIAEDSATILSSASSAGSLDLDSTGSITDNGTADLAIVGLADFAGTSIVLDRAAVHDFGTLTFSSAGAVVIDEQSDMDLVGTNMGLSANLDSGGDISDAGAASTTIVGLGDFDGTNISLDANFNTGTLTFNSAGSVLVDEGSSINIVGSNIAGSTNFDSTAAISDAGATSVAIGGLGDFNGTSISLGGGTFNAGTLQFNSAGAVVIAEDSATVLAGTSAAASLNLDSAAGISDNGTADLTIAGLADFAGTSIVVNDNTHNFGTLTFNSAGAVTIVESSAMVLANANTAGTLTLTAAGITDTGNVIVTGDTTLSSGAVAMTLDSAANDFQGTLNVNNTAGNVTIHDANDLVVGTATVGGNLILNIDDGANEAATLDLSGSTLAIGGAASVFNGQGTDDTLLAPNTANIFTFAGTNSGTFSLGGEAGTFSDFGNITGGTTTDQFIMTTGTITGNVDGGTVAAVDTLSYAGGPAATIVLTAIGSVDGFTGTGTSIGGTFDNIDTLVGSSNTDSLQGINANATWTIDNSSYNSTNFLNFSEIENLIGGTGTDIFNIVANHTGDISDIGGNDTINFNAGTLTGLISLGSGSGADVNTYDFNGGAHSGNVFISGDDIWNHVNGVSLGNAVTGNGSLSITNSDNPGDLEFGANGINLPTMTGFTGHLIIGGLFTDNPNFTGTDDPNDVFSGNRNVTLNTATLDVNAPIITGGDITFLAQNINLTQIGSFASPSLSAGGLGGARIAMIAIGDGTNGGVIAGPNNPSYNLQGGSLLMAATDNVSNAANIEINLNGGEFVLSISDGAQAPQFAVLDATVSEGDQNTVDFLQNTEFNLASLGIAGFLNIDAVVNTSASTLVFAANLIGLEQLAFIDVGLFEEDLSLFGIIGSGVALALAQCEEVEGCAPDVSESELEELIIALQARIDELEKRLEDAQGADRAKIEELLSGYRQEMENFQGYKQQLQEYYSDDEDYEEDEGDGFGEDSGPTVGDQIQSLSNVLEVTQRRIEWLESLKGDADARAKLSESTGIDLTIETIDTIIDATKQEVLLIEKQIQLLQEGTQALSRPVFWAEASDYNNIHDVDYGNSLLSINIDSVAKNDGLY